MGRKSAKKHLQRIARRQSRFVRDSNHCISKKIVETAIATRKALALEDLKHIRERASGYSRHMRWLMGNWAFNQLAEFIRYKAEAAGMSVISVDPKYTSQTCSMCGYLDRANRPSQARFKCQVCGFEAHADANAAVVIEARGVLSYTLMSQPSG